MNTIKKIWFERNRIYMETNNSEIYSRPLEAFPILKAANDKHRKSYKIGKDKTDIRWDELDEDIHINSFFSTAEPDFNIAVARTLKQFPEINIFALANQIFINKSLLVKYIYGIKKPSDGRKKEIEKGLPVLGEKLLTVEL
ncbi:MAG: DUF2442 domain-containing protein [Ginsengibacter sp.]